MARDPIVAFPMVEKKDDDDEAGAPEHTTDSPVSWERIFDDAADGYQAIVGGDTASIASIASKGLGALGIPSVISEPLMNAGINGIKFVLNAIFFDKKRHYATCPVVRRCSVRLTGRDGKDNFREGIMIQAAYAVSTESKAKAKKGLESMISKPSASGAWSTAASSYKTELKAGMAANPAQGSMLYEVPLQYVDAERAPAIVIFPQFFHTRPGYGNHKAANGLMYLMSFLMGKPLGLFPEFCAPMIGKDAFESPSPFAKETTSLTCRRIPEPQTKGDKGQQWLDVLEVYDPLGTTKHFYDTTDIYAFLSMPATEWSSQWSKNKNDPRLSTVMLITNWGNGRKIDEISETNAANLWFDSPKEAQPRDLLAAAFGIQSLWSWQIPTAGENTLQVCPEVTTIAYESNDAYSKETKQEVTDIQNVIIPPLSPSLGSIVPMTTTEHIGDSGMGIGLLVLGGLALYALSRR